MATLAGVDAPLIHQGVCWPSAGAPCIFFLLASQMEVKLGLSSKLAYSRCWDECTAVLDCGPAVCKAPCLIGDSTLPDTVVA